jgi:hypothetical protein
MGKQRERGWMNARLVLDDTFSNTQTQLTEAGRERGPTDSRAGDGDRTSDVQGRKTIVFHCVSRPERPTCQLGKLTSGYFLPLESALSASILRTAATS